MCQVFFLLGKTKALVGINEKPTVQTRSFSHPKALFSVFINKYVVAKLLTSHFTEACGLFTFLCVIFAILTCIPDVPRSHLHRDIELFLYLLSGLKNTVTVNEKGKWRIFETS
jgi:hypothetical protein